MPFKKVNPKEELEQCCKNDNEFAKLSEEFDKEYNAKKEEINKSRNK